MPAAPDHDLRYRTHRLDDDDFDRYAGIVRNEAEMLRAHTIDSRAARRGRRRAVQRQGQPLVHHDPPPPAPPLKKVQGGGADEAGDEEVVGPIIQVEWRAHL